MVAHNIWKKICAKYLGEIGENIFINYDYCTLNTFANNYDFVELKKLEPALKTLNLGKPQQI